MAKPEITIEIDGKRHRLAMPLGALEDVAAVNPALGTVYMGLLMASWDLPEVAAVLNAGIRYGSRDITFEAIVEARGIGGAADIARALIEAAWGDAKKPLTEAAETPA